MFRLRKINKSPLLRLAENLDFYQHLVEI